MCCRRTRRTNIWLFKCWRGYWWTVRCWNWWYKSFRRSTEKAGLSTCCEE